MQLFLQSRVAKFGSPHQLRVIASMESASVPTTKKKNFKEPKPVCVARNAVDLQRMKLQKLMDHPEKPVVIPEPPKEKILASPPEFNRNVMGSSAGAGSGEFHVYRHIRRREYARQKYISEKADKEKKNEEFHAKLEEHRKLAEVKTAKKRSKRMKRKANIKMKRLKAKEISVSKEDEPKPVESDEQETDKEEEDDDGDDSD